MKETVVRLPKRKSLQWRRLNPGYLAAALACIATLSTSAYAQVSAADVPSVPVQTWVREAASREIDIILHTGSYIRYKQHTIDTKGNELRDVIESKDGTVARLLMRDNRPLTDDEDKAERARLAGLLENPSDFAKHAKNVANNKKQAIDLIELMPEAMVYTYASDQASTPGSNGSQVVLDYAPNPKFNPPTTISQALSGLRGKVWIDTRTKTIVRIDGEIFKGVNFGWGMLAHIYPGGKVGAEQADALDGRWNLTHFHEQITMKALMIKNINVKTEVNFQDFQQLPGMTTYQDAIRFLLDTPLPK